MSKMKNGNPSFHPPFSASQGRVRGCAASEGMLSSRMLVSSGGCDDDDGGDAADDDDGCDDVM